jgi:signal transduction histidine kinase
MQDFFDSLWSRSIPSVRRVRWLGVLLPMLLWTGVLFVRASLADKVPAWVEWTAELTLVAAGCFIFANWVATNFERHQREMDARAQQLEALREAGIALTTETALEPLLQRVVDESRALAGAKYAALGVLSDDGKRIDQFIFSGMEPNAREMIGTHPMAVGLLGLILESSQPVRIDNIAEDPRAAGYPDSHIPMRTLLGVAVVARGKVLGNLYLADKLDPESEAALPFTEIDARTLEMFATHASIAIENARLQQQNQQLAIMQERERFGMNMHDGIIQSLYALGLILEDAEHRVESEPMVARQRLRQTIDGLNQVIRDIRAYIMDLRPQRFEESTMALGLERLVQNLSAHWSLRVQTTIDPEAAALIDSLGSSATRQKSELLHIAQEALTNINKHARATVVSVVLALDEGDLVLTITDNGQGFDVFQTARSSTGNGLRNMQQRARALHGELEIQSLPGSGTTLTLSLPLLHPQPTPAH